MKHTHLHRGRGFTLIELIIAISIMSLMVFLINTLFFQTQRAVSVGIQTGDMLMANETISSQIERDATNMIGPTGGGFLVIINKLYTNQPIRTRDGDSTEDIRSDQLLFFAGGSSDYTSLTPEELTTFESTRTASQAKIWYGHVEKTDYTGLTGSAKNSYTDQFYGLDNPDSNYYANRWILGRQAMLLIDSGILTGSIYVDGLPTESQNVAGYPSTIWNPYLPSNSTYTGLSDVANRTLTDITTPLSYPGGAIDYAYPTRRLRINPFPFLDGTTPTLEAWRFAQTHSHLANNVSDFIVEFAGDYDVTAGIDKDAITGDIIWYSGIPNTTDTARPPVSSITAADLSPNHLDTTARLNSNAAFVFRHDDISSKWPYLIRIRYRMHDAEGRIVSANSARTSNTIDDDGDTVVDEEDEATVNGQWFEQIIKVNRP